MDKSLAALLRRFDDMHAKTTSGRDEMTRTPSRMKRRKKVLMTMHMVQILKSKTKILFTAGYVIIEEVRVVINDVRYMVMMMLLVRLNLRYLLLMVNMILMLILLGKLLLIKKLHAMNFLKLHLLGLLLVSLLILLLFGG